MVFQADFLPALLPSSSQFLPDLTLLVMLSWSLFLRWEWSLPLAFSIGLALDLLSPGLHPVGLNPLLYTLLAFLVSLISQKPFSTGVIRAIPITFAAALLYRVLLLLGQQVLGYNIFQINILIGVVLPVAIIDATLMLGVFILVRLISRIKAPAE